MRSFFREYKKFAIFFLVLASIIIWLFYNALKPVKRLPIFQPADINVELVDSTLQHIKNYHKVANFQLTNQNGKVITQKDYADKIYVADFFFTTCQTICPKMTANLYDVQMNILEDDEVMLLSHTVTPEIDSVGQLKKYAIEKGVKDHKWNLVTGDRKQIYDLARKSYLVAKTYGKFDDYNMVHTENFALVDKEGRIRGMYDGTNTEEIERLLEEIAILKEEYK